MRISQKFLTICVIFSEFIFNWVIPNYISIIAAPILSIVVLNHLLAFFHLGVSTFIHMVIPTSVTGPTRIIHGAQRFENHLEIAYH